MNNLAKYTEAASFAARKHTGQRRKGDDAAPYINHPLDVANLLANVGKIEDYDVLIAALLHDTIEDTETTEKEITEKFGATVCDYVLEVTDDKSLPKAERKQLQIEHSAHISKGAKSIKLGDKISNIRDVTENPPADWNEQRRLEYIEWGEKVINQLRGANEYLEKYFDDLIKNARETIGVNPS